MVSDSCVVERLNAHNLEVVFPQADDIERVHQVIIDELTINVFTEESKQFYLAVMQRLCDEQHVEGIILGCTGEKTIDCSWKAKGLLVVEIPLLVKQSDFPRVPLFDSTQLHVSSHDRIDRLESVRSHRSNSPLTINSVDVISTRFFPPASKQSIEHLV